MTGVPVATLRTWEERYGVIVPGRSRGGHRLYSRDDVEQLRFVAERVAAGLAPADAHRLLADRRMTGAAVSPMEAPSGSRLLVLLAERDPNAADLCEYFLRTEGYEVQSVFDTSEALDVVAMAKPQVAVVDLLISGGDGLELCRQLVERGPAVVAISTLDSRDEALQVGAAAFLLKPLDPLQLVSTVRDLLGDSAYLRSRR